MFAPSNNTPSSFGLARDFGDPFCLRVQNRAPKHKGLVKAGPRAGLPYKDQTHTRDHLTWQDALSLFDAEQFAAHINLPLNTFLTVAWKHGPRFDGNDSKMWQDRLRVLSRTCANFVNMSGIPLTWVYDHERAVCVGGHTHILMHLAARRWRADCQALTNSIQYYCGLSGPFAVKISSSRTGASAGINSRLGVLKYLCKTLNPAELHVLGRKNMGGLAQYLGIRPEPGLRLPDGLKRTGTTQNIGPKARSDAGWVDKRTVEQLAEELLRLGNTGLDLAVPANRLR